MSKPITPSLAADVIIELSDRPGQIVLIERRNFPFGAALPGGFVDVGERVEAAAVREAMEEVSLAARLICLLGLYSTPERDPRGHTVSAVYVASATGTPRAEDDAKAIIMADPADRSLSLAFDHRQILDDYLDFRETGSPAPLRF